MYSIIILILFMLAGMPHVYGRAPQETAEEQATIAVRKLWSENDSVRQQGKRQLLELGAKAVPQLIELTKSLTLDRRPRFATGKEQEGEKLLERFLDLKNNKPMSEHRKDMEAFNAADIRPRLEADVAELFAGLNADSVLPSLVDLLKWEGLEFSSHTGLMWREWTPSMEALERRG